MSRTFFHSGDIGDCIAALPSIRALGGGNLIIGFKPDGQRQTLAGVRFEALAPLLLAQSYIHSVSWGEPPSGCVDFSGFRLCPHDGMNLAYWQAKYAGAVVSMEPWLMVDPIKHGRPVIARSSRYHNMEFPWRKILPMLVDPVFVGLPDEHKEFCSEFGWQVERHHTATLLETARFIAGARVFVGNQSAPFWIAAALGVKTVQETYHLALNSIIHRPGMSYPLFNNYDISAVLK